MAGFLPTRVNPAAREWRWALMLGVATVGAFLLRWYYIQTAETINPIRGDARQYVAYALNLACHGTFSSASPDSGMPVPDSYRDPGYPLFLAFFIRLQGTGAEWLHAVLMGQAMLGALTVALTMQLGRSWLGPRWCLAAGVALAIWPQTIAISGVLLSETLAGFLCIAALLVSQLALARNSMTLAIAAGLGFGMAGLTNAVLVPFGVLLALYAGWRRFGTPRVWIALALAAVLLPAAWQVRSATLPATTGADSRNSSVYRAMQNLVQGANPSYHVLYEPSLAGDPVAQRLMGEIDEEINLLHDAPAAGLARIADRIGQHPLRHLSWYLLEKPWHLWNWGIGIGQDDIHVFPVVHTPFYETPAMVMLAVVCRLASPPLAATLLASLMVFVVWHFRMKAWPALPAGLSSACLLVAYVTVVYGLLQSDPRYSIPFRPYEMLIAATVWQILFSMKTKGQGAGRGIVVPMDQADRDDAEQ